MSRVAIVTGGTRGIGAAIGRKLKEHGYRVAVNYTSNDAAAAAYHKETGIPVYKWNVASFDECKAGVAKVEAEIGSCEILVNNAGITRDVMLHRMTPEKWHEVIDVNLNGVFNMCRQVIEGMRARGFGRVINISSINGQAGQLGQTNYSASKAALFGFTKALAIESATKGITVNAIAPGYIETDMVAAVPPEALKAVVARIPVGRLGKPEEVAQAVLFLARDDSAFVTASTLTVNGAQYVI
ncbi:MAG: acetoacetyl-CoA reductase [Alphaproteobacteria bacterium]|nr:acetoacetyl-CoA reductase [Alphaproteobacteria bacterium]